MGCDIHCNIEVKENGIWKLHAPLIPNSWYDPKEPIDRWNKPERPDKGWFDRYYDVFAIMANVRNGRGFAGIKTGQGFNVISQPKGLPEDVSPEVKADSDEWDSDGHSHSWLSLQEILDFNWDQVTEKQGYLTDEEYAKWDKKSTPESWCGFSAGRDIISLDEKDYLALPKKQPGKTYSILVNWVVSYREGVGESWWQMVDRLKKYREQFEDVRLVFWFDN